MTFSNRTHALSTLNRYWIILLPLFFVLGCTTKTGKGEQALSSKRIQQVDFSQVKITDNFWSPRLKSHVTTTLPVCIDQIEHKTGRIRNFENAANKSGEHSGIFYDDSDVYKALEGMAYSLINYPDPQLEQKCDEWIEKLLADRSEQAVG